MLTKPILLYVIIDGEEWLKECLLNSFLPYEFVILEFKKHS